MPSAMPSGGPPPPPPPAAAAAAAPLAVAGLLAPADPAEPGPAAASLQEDSAADGKRRTTQ